MGLKRKPFQGVGNIIRFNWHFFLLDGIVIIILASVAHIFSEPVMIWLYILVGVSLVSTGISLLVSYYVYDVSELYRFAWFPKAETPQILNINAGFDETSAFIQERYPKGELTIADFYDPQKHTEVSVKRARKAYPPHEGTISVSTTELPFQNHQFDSVFAILSAHEIRDEKERIQFFSELKRVCKPGGQIYVTEHLRDLNNLLAYTVGAFHFHSRSSWLRVFYAAGLKLKQEKKITPFITTFTLESDGNTF